jgi:hypothetical protein
MKKKKRSLGAYVVVALVIVNSVVWYMGGLEELRNVELISVGFLLGMLACIQRCIFIVGSKHIYSRSKLASSDIILL